MLGDEVINHRFGRRAALGHRVGALAAFANPYDTDDSKATIEVQPTAGDTRTHKLPKGGVDLATAVTEQAA